MAVFKVTKSDIDGILIDELSGTAQSVVESLYDLNTDVFTAVKPVTRLVFEGLITTFTSKRTAFKLGGTSAKLPYETAHAALLACLYLFIPYVNGIANGNETILKLSMLPYSDGTSTTKAKIQSGEVPTMLVYTPGTSGMAKTSCAVYGGGAKYMAIYVQGLLPVGTTVNIDGQLSMPEGSIMPPFFINFNGKRDKTVTGLLPRIDYNVYYLVMCGGIVSGWSLPLKIACLTS